MLWLYGLGGVDFVFSVIILILFLMRGWLDHDRDPPSLTIGIAGVLSLMQWSARVVELVIAARWTARMAGRHIGPQQIASPTWSWLAWFVPVVSLWLPCVIVLRLNRDANGRSRNGPLIVAWWLARWLTCPLGGLLSFAVWSFIPDVRHAYIPAVMWIFLFAIPSALAAGLGIAVRRLTFANQPGDNAMLAATVF